MTTNHPHHHPRKPDSNNTYIGICLDAISRIAIRAGRTLRTPRGLAIAATIVIVTTGYIIINLTRPQSATTQTTTTTAAQVVESLEYQTILPADKPIDTLGGWRQISPPGSDPVYAYTDTIDTVTITVSQQPLPQSFKGTVDTSIADMAKKFSATTKLTAGTTTAYIGTSAKGPQSVIFTKNGLLILIKSHHTINDTAWVSYINSLD